MMDIKALAYGEKEYITALRRHFHAYPELGRHEVETTKRITEELENMGDRGDDVQRYYRLYRRYPRRA